MIAKEKLSDDAQEARVQLVEEHICCENGHDLEGIMRTFGENPAYADLPRDKRHQGRDGVRSYYEQLLEACPDLEIEVRQRHVTAEAIILETVIHGTHQGFWRGLPPANRRIDFPLCAVYTFDESNKLAGERIYYDRATLLEQLGIARDPENREVARTT